MKKEDFAELSVLSLIYDKGHTFESNISAQPVSCAHCAKFIFAYINQGI